jgi:hypothetical protein
MAGTAPPRPAFPTIQTTEFTMNKATDTDPIFAAIERHRAAAAAYRAASDLHSPMWPGERGEIAAGQQRGHGATRRGAARAADLPARAPCRPYDLGVCRLPRSGLLAGTNLAVGVVGEFDPKRVFGAPDHPARSTVAIGCPQPELIGNCAGSDSGNLRTVA